MWDGRDQQAIMRSLPACFLTSRYFQIPITKT